MANKKTEVVAASAITVGTMLWFFDEGKHRTDQDGKYLGRGDWVCHQIADETVKSWLLGVHYTYGYQFRVSKRDLCETRRRGYGNKIQWHTEQSKEEKLWDGENRYLVRAATERCSIAKLKRIKAVLDEPEET